MLSQLRAIKALGWRSVFRASKLKRLSQETIRGFFTTRVLIALFNIGFFDAFSEQPTVNLGVFTTQNNLNLDVLRTLCDYLFSLKILNRDGDNYWLDSKGRFVVEMLRGVFYSVYAYEDIFYHLEALLKEDKKYGTDVNRRPEFVAKGSGAIGKLLAFPMVIDLLKRNKFERVLDLGCGNATFLIDLCESNGCMTGYGLDISAEAIAAGQRNLAQKNLQQRVQLFVGDIFELDVIANQLRGIDAATCIYVLHEFLTDDSCQILALLGKFKEAFPGVPLIICEVIQHTPEELRRKPGGILEIQLFHNLSNQTLTSRSEWHALFRQAGFMNIKEDYLDFVRTAIYIVS